MGRPAYELERTISAAELAEWMAFYALAPFGPEAEWLRHGVVCAAISNLMRSGGRAAMPQDFMPRRPDDAPAMAMTPAQARAQRDLVRAQLAAVFAGKIVRAKPDGQ